MSIESDLSPLMREIYSDRDEKLRGCRTEVTPLREAAFCIYNLGEWLDQHPDALPEPAESFSDIVRSIYDDLWERVEEVAATDFERITTGGSFVGGDVLVTAVECIFAAAKCHEAGRHNEAWSFAIDARHMVSIVIGGWITRAKVKRINAVENAGHRWEDDPTQGPKIAIYAAWKQWYTDRRKYPQPRDFRAAMLSQHSTVPDGTLKNWMSDWPKGKNLPRSSRS